MHEKGPGLSRAHPEEQHTIFCAFPQPLFATGC